MSHDEEEPFAEFTFAAAVASERARISDSEDFAYHEPLAKLFLREKKKKMVTTSSQEDETNEFPRPPKRGQVTAVVARHMIIDTIVNKVSTAQTHGPKQIVILGAGFDTRASRFANLPLRWFEIDLPEPAQYKETVLNDHGLDGDLHAATRIQLDLLNEDWVDALQKEGWDRTCPTIYILEGLIYYFSTEQAKNLLKTIPAIPNSQIIVSIIDRNLLKSWGVSKSLFQTNFYELQRAGAFDLPNYRLIQKYDTIHPEKYKLGVSCYRRPPINLWWRLVFWFHRQPTEFVFHFHAV